MISQTIQIVFPILKNPKIEQHKNFIDFDNVQSQNKAKLKVDGFLKKIGKRWSVLCYTDQLLANQIAVKPVRISCHVIEIDTDHFASLLIQT